MKKILLVAICLISFTVIKANESESYTIEKIISVYDGDTFRADIRGLPDIIGKNIAIRILGIDTPEIKGKCEEEKIVAIKARDFSRNVSSAFSGRNHNNEKIKLNSIVLGWSQFAGFFPRNRACS